MSFKTEKLPGPLADESQEEEKMEVMSEPDLRRLLRSGLA